jgi:hypothetical protein
VKRRRWVFPAAPISFPKLTESSSRIGKLFYGVDPGGAAGAEFLANTAFGCVNFSGIRASAWSRSATNWLQSRFATGSDGGKGSRSKFKNCPCF